MNVGFIIWSKNFLLPLKTKEIVRFETAKKLAVAESIITEWKSADDGRMEKAIQSIYVDYIFIVLYTTGLTIACIYLSQLTGHEVLKKAGRFIPFLVVGAGVCDIIENMAMLNSFTGHLNGWNVLVAYDMAVTKFSIVILTLIFVLVCLIFSMLTQMNAKNGRK